MTNLIRRLGKRLTECLSASKRLRIVERKLPEYDRRIDRLEAGLRGLRSEQQLIEQARDEGRR